MYHNIEEYHDIEECDDIEEYHDLERGCPRKKFLLGYDLYIKENTKFSSSILIISFLCISGIVLNTEPFLADI